MINEKDIADLRIIYGIPIQEICKKYNLTEEYINKLITQYNGTKPLPRALPYSMRQIIKAQIRKGVPIEKLCFQFKVNKIQIEKWIEPKITVPYKVYTQSEKEKAVKMKEEGMTYKKISTITNIPESTIARWVKLKGMPTPSPKYSEAIKEQVINYHLQGMTYQKIYEKLGVPICTISRWYSTYKMNLKKEQE